MNKILVLVSAVALFGASHATPYGLYGENALRGQSRLAMQEALLTFRSTCEEVSGSDAGYRKTISSLTPAIQCLAENVDTLQFSIDLADGSDTAEARQQIIDKYCPAFNESVACFDDVLEGVAMCGNDKVSTIKTMYKKMIHNMIDLMCKNNGQLLLEARTPEFRTCIQHVKENVKQCRISEIIRTRPISQFGEEGCSELKRSKKCIHEQISSCTTTAYEDIFNAIYDPMAETANCKLNVQSEFSENDI
uniref:Putative conserved secreted protein n=1 Tax=Culex tarsalis TaxID=7177 RepID=A0A1Q3FQ72_CULTA